MNSIKTPVSVDAHPFAESPTSDKNSYGAIILDAENGWVFGNVLGGYSTPEEALADPLANELRRVINAHGALVSSLERMVYWLSAVGWIASNKDMRADVDAAHAALALAKGEQQE